MLDPKDLKPCPFCGGGTTLVEPKHLPPRMTGPGALVSVTIRHWCGQTPGVHSGGVTFTGKDEESVKAAWERRFVPPPAPRRQALTLASFGWAPGNYVFRCVDCTPAEPKPRDWAIGDKRAWRCEPCAQKRLNEAMERINAGND